MLDNVFYQIGAILGLAAAGGALALLLRQPLIVAFIAVGILLGPSGFGVVVQSGEIELFARLGIALLLFVVGLKLDVHIIRTVGPVALLTGLGQIVFTSVIGYLVSVQKRGHFQIDLERRRTISVLAEIFRRYTGSIVQMHD